MHEGKREVAKKIHISQEKFVKCKRVYNTLYTYIIYVVSTYISKDNRICMIRFIKFYANIKILSSNLESYTLKL